MKYFRKMVISAVLGAACLSVSSAHAFERLEELSPPDSRALTMTETDAFNKAMQSLISNNVDVATRLLTPLAESGVLEAQIALGNILARSPFEKELKQALKWYYFAAQKSDWRSQVQVAAAYTDGKLVGQDFYKARTWLDRAANNGGEDLQVYYDALNNKVRTLAQDAISANEYKQAESLLIPAAHAGDHEAQVLLAEMYQRGFLGKQDDKTRYWLEKAADSGSREAKYALAMNYLSSTELSDEEKSKVVNLLQSAADPGLADAQYRLGVLYLTGSGVDKNTEQGLRWYRLAAEQGNTDAQYSLGVRYVLGKDVEKNDYEAHRWFKRAAEQGMPKAEHNLALTYLHGIGTEKQPEQARQWFQKAALAGVEKSSAFLPPVEKPLPKEKVASTPKESKPAREKVVLELVKKPKAHSRVIKGGEWFSKLNDKGFTLQLISSHRAESVEAFIDEYHLDRKKYVHYIKPDKGSDWHVVQYGYFKNRTDAMKEANRLSKNFKRFKPWVREVKAVRESMEQS